MTNEELFNLLNSLKQLPDWETYNDTGLDTGVAIWFDTEEVLEVTEVKKESEDD